MANGLLASKAFLSCAQDRAPDEPAPVNDVEMFRAVEGVAAQIAGKPVVFESFKRLLVIFRLRQRHNSVQNHRRAVADRAILAGANERAVTNK